MSLVLISEFTDHLTKSGKSKSTIIAYKKDLHQLLELLNKELHLTNAEELNNAVSDLKQKYEFTAKTVSRKINSYRTFYKFLLSNGQVSTNPAELVEHPKFSPRKQRVLSQMEYLALREVSRSNPRLHAMIELMLQTGIRIGEASRLKVSHVELLESKGSLYVEPFSSVPARRVPLNQKAIITLSTYINSLGKNISAEQPLFSTRDGNHIIIRNIRSSVDRAMLKAEIANACVNDLRNTFIVAQLQAGAPIDYIAEIVGHKSKATTQKYLELLNGKYSPKGDMKVVEL